MSNGDARVVHRGPASGRYADVRAWLLEVDPELVDAATEVDGTLLDSAASMPLLQLLSRATSMAHDLSRLADQLDR